MENENQFRRLFSKLFKVNKQIQKRGGPENVSELFDDFVSVEEDILQLFNLTSTSENQVLLQSQLDENNEREAGRKTLELLKQKAVVDNEKNEAPLEILLKAVSAGEYAENVLPRIGIENHTYPIFLYNLLPGNIDSLVEIYNEMVRANKYLDELGRIKNEYNSLKSKNLKFLDAYLSSKDS